MLQLRRLENLSEDTAVFPWNKSTPYPAIEATLAVALAIALGELTGHRAAAAIAAGAAFTVGFAVFHEALSSALLSMALLTAGIASATLAGSLGAHWTPLVLLLCLLAAFNYGLLASLDPTASWIGQQCGVYVVIASYFNQGVHYAVGRTAMVLAGGLLQMLLFAASRLFRRHRQLSPDAKPSQPPPLPLFRQMRTRIGQLGRHLRGQLHLDTGTVRYTAKLVLTLGLTTALYRYLHLHNGYWAPMTALLVLKPQWASTLSRGIARLAGTLVGAALTLLLAHLFPPFHHWIYFALILLTAYLCFAIQAVNYALFSTSLTLYTVFLFAFGGFSERSAAGLRLLNTALGGGFALLLDYTAKKLLPPPNTTPSSPAGPPL